MHEHANPNYTEEVIVGRLGSIVIGLLARNEPLTREKIGGRETYTIVLQAKDLMDDIAFVARAVAERDSGEKE